MIIKKLVYILNLL